MICLMREKERQKRGREREREGERERVCRDNRLSERLHFGESALNERSLIFPATTRRRKWTLKVARKITAGRKLRLARCHHASRRGGGSMGGTAPAAPRHKSKRHLPERRHPGTGQDRPASGTTVQTDEESLQHHEAIQPHQTGFHDQHRCKQARR